MTVAEEQLATKTKELFDLHQEVVALKESEKFLVEKVSGFKQELEELHRLSKEEFKNMASQIMEERQQAFVAANKKELADVIDPFKGRLDEFRQKVEATRKEDIADLTSLKKEIGSLEKLSQQLSDDAKNLTMALKADVKIQGTWGEDRLNLILEAEGLQKYIDFTREEHFRDAE